MLDLTTAQTEQLHMLMREFEGQIAQLIGKDVRIKITNYSTAIERDYSHERSTIEDVMYAVELALGVSVEEQISEARPNRIVDARYIGWHIIKSVHPLITYKDLGIAYGNKNHSTVMSGLARFLDYRVTNKEFDQKYNETLKKFNEIKRWN